MNRPLLLLVILFMFSLISCNHLTDDIVQSENDIRTQFLKGKSKSEIQFEYHKLEIGEMKNLWISKLNQTLEGELKEVQKKLVKDLIFELRKVSSYENLYNENIKNIGLKLAENFTFEDFVGSFSTLNNYSVSNNNFGFCEVCFASFSDDWGFNTESFRILAEDSPCNCKWTCGGTFGPEVDCTTDKCEETSSGCGFLWLQTCKERDVLIDTDGDC